ncbi:hypothetical protein ARMGADRAFT_1008640 [Armillaria gallica]|uniref:Uncharacterized protein n=1 Tax=Armillaria gallica TaxID=47427 RepID=A0A2H3E4T9_ARMGA|nr:hypothetical protein ARMGADRAFT_1008640 [Armillaria gallica]
MAESNQMRTRNSSPCRRLTVTPSKSLFPSPLVEDHCIQVEHGEFVVIDLLLVSNTPSRRPLLEFSCLGHLGSHPPCDRGHGRRRCFPQELGGMALGGCQECRRDEIGAKQRWF